MSRLATLDEMHEHYSDFYKEVYGIRPRWARFATIEDAGVAILQLNAEAKLVFAQKDREEAEAAEAVEKTINSLIASGAGDRATAISWLHDANNTNGDDEYLCYCLDIKYGYFKGEKQ
jgi:hypothetical protein